MKLSICLDALYFDLKYFGASPENCLEGMKLAKKAGFDAVEFFGPKKDIASIAKLKSEIGIDVSAIAVTDSTWTCSPGPDIRVPFITLCDPSLLGTFLSSLRQSIEDAKQLDCRFIITHAGDTIQNVPRQRQRDSIVAALKEAAKLLEGGNLTLILEPVNAIDHPGDFITSSKEAFAILDEVGSPNVKLLYDIYHQQVMEGNITATITKYIKQIAYLHGASNPDRSDIRFGEISYQEVLKAVAKKGYNGFFGLEYGFKENLTNILRETVEFLRQADTD